MKIGLRGGHSPNCKGAMGHLDEQAEVRKIYNELAPMLQAAGHTVIDCNSNASSVSGELSEGTNKANNNNCDYFISIHMNAANWNVGGTEIWLYDEFNATTTNWALKICSNFEAKGFSNRGIKYNTGYHDLNATAMPAMIIETLFCDSPYDTNLYKSLGAKTIASLIANAIAGTAIGGGSSTSSTTSSNNNIYRIRTSWDNVKSQVGAYRNLDSAKAQCPSGYTVYDWNGNAVYSNNVSSTSTSKLYRVRTSWSDAKSQVGAFASLDNAKKCADDETSKGVLKYIVYDWNGSVVYTGGNSSTTTIPTTPTEPDVEPDDNTTIETTEYPDISPLKGFSQDEFIEYIGVLAAKDMKDTGVLASVTIAQAILESAYGQSELSLKANNLFGMKASLSGNTWDSEWDGTTYEKSSAEEYDGVITQVVSKFRKYGTIAQSIKDHSDYLLGAKNGSALRYDGLKGETDYRTAIQIIKDGGYATDSGYVDKICNIIETYKLDEYDTEKKQDTTIDDGADDDLKESVSSISNMLARILEIVEKILAFFSKKED